MRKYTLRELTIKITGVKESEMYWESAYQQVRRIDKVIRGLAGIKEVTDINLDNYINIVKEIYCDKYKMSIMNKYYNIIKSSENKESVITFPVSKKEVSNEESLIIYKILLQLIENETICCFIEQAITEIISEEYNKLLLEFEEEIKKIKYSIQGYKYEYRLEKMEEITNYLKNQRIEMDKNIQDNLIIY